MNPTPKYKLLIIDDTPANIHILLEALRDSYRIQAATRGDKGLELARADPQPDLILLDVVMEGMDGYEVCKALQADVRTAKIPVIFITAQSDEEDEARGLAMGAVDFISKPFRIVTLKARIQHHLELRMLRDRLDQQVQEQVHEIINSHITTLFAMSQLAEARDDEVGVHLERIQRYCQLLATSLKESNSFPGLVDDEFIRRVTQASPLHDIGKLAIPEHILNKPEKLTRDEFEIMKKHTVRAAETLQGVVGSHPDNEFLKLGVEIARSHHEKWDGSGYPDGLRGEAIPLAARIMALADVYDALTSRRSYKPAFSHEQACEIILRQKGYHFDPKLVDMFFLHEQEFAQVARGGSPPE